MTTQDVRTAGAGGVAGGSWSSTPADGLGHRFRVVTETTEPALVERLAAVVSPLSAAVEADVTYSVVSTGSHRYTLSCDGRPVSNDLTPGLTARHLTWHVNRSAVEAAGAGHTVLHAAAARRADCTVVLAAPMGRGKTTTVAGLLAQGWDYVTDEAVALRRGDLTIAPFPKALALDPGSWKLFPGAQPSWKDADDDRQWQVPAHVLGARHVQEPVIPTIVVLPRFASRGRTHVAAVTAADAVTLLARCTFGFPARGTDDLDVLVRLARSCPVYSLEIADLASAVQLISDLAKDVGWQA